MSSNHLVTAGCSFTISDGDRIGNGNKSWARHLDDKLEDVEVCSYCTEFIRLWY